MRKQLWIVTLGTFLFAAITGTAAQTAKSQSHVIGCVQRNGGVITMKDARSNDVYQLDLPSQYEWHVGHQVEVAGTITDAKANPIRLKVESLIYIASSCWK